MKKRIVVLGSTGSIGTQALEVVAENPQDFEIVGIAAAGSNPSLIVHQAKALGLSGECVAVAGDEAAKVVSAELGSTVISGADSAAELVRNSHCDTVLNALVGSLGLAATLATLEKGAKLALANKESLVAGGSIVLEKAQPGQLIPVDSEHSAMAQCLMSGSRSEVDRFVLTASGGPFRGWTREQMLDVTPEQAAKHPTWSMGQMNTLNSATLVNKGLELIEACLLFDLDPQLIDVTVHPQSIIHSMVTFHDGATIAQASPPSMKLPISMALDWPRRVSGAQPALDFRESMSWTFEPVDNDAFPAVELARLAVEKQGSYAAAYNAANEEAAAAFLGSRIRFPEIVDTVATVLNEDSFVAQPRDFLDVLEAEKIARQRAQEHLSSLSR